ncbi:hypothetical protein [Helicobacter sp. 13S00477-4]|uniref:hypothetical protein n=1 Tax=Helicobacter sp. 13S00477-4 TaxID=1905759 RepID=UPI000BA54F4B|nr:hypothetical protein [Helicobacter sp. 13S00477-4]PAF50856.1 hypothetical protein BKH44_06825 [Helicobacter sp. 13S00477-4]
MRLGVILAGIVLGFLAIEGYIYVRIKTGVQAQLAKELLQRQNQAIAKQALDTKNYIKTLSKEKIITKYKVIHPKEEGCEGKLEEIKDAMDVYFDSFKHML